MVVDFWRWKLFFFFYKFVLGFRDYNLRVFTCFVMRIWFVVTRTVTGFVCSCFVESAARRFIANIS